MRRIVTNIVAAGFLTLAGVASAQTGMTGGYDAPDGTAASAQRQELKAIVQDIYVSQGVSDRAEIDCSKITDDKFEELGEAYMSAMHPDPEQHEAMDAMMGGEGSASLRQAHINMGRSYLGCWSGYAGAPVGMMPARQSFSGGGGGYGMMGGYGSYDNSYGGNGMMGWGWPSMMGGYYGGYGLVGVVTTLLIWTLLILGIVALVKWIKKQKQ